jgi:type I restriction enzyme, S subunit
MADPWPTRELGIAGVRVFDCEHKTPEQAEQGYPYIAIPNLVDGRLKLDNVRLISEGDFVIWTRRTKPRPGDVIVTRRGRVGDSAVIPYGVSCAIGQNLVILRSTGKTVDQGYLRWALRSPQWKSEVDRLHNVGAVFDSLNVSEIPRIRIPVPPVPSQKSISAMLTAIDDKIALNDRVANTSLSLAQAQYDEVANSESWHSLPMGQSARWLSGGTPSTMEPSYWDGDIPWISALSLKSPWIADSERKVTRFGVEHGTRVVPKGTIIFVVRGSSLDTEFRIGLTQREVAFGQDCKALLPADGIDPAVLFLAIRSHSSGILTLVDHAGHGAGRLATDLISNVQIRLPDQPLEAEICSLLQNLVGIGALRQSENRTLLELRDLLLPGLMSGEIRVRDAERAVEEAT